VFGAHPQASDTADTALGEVEIPNIPPPVFYVWTESPTPTERLWFSPKDYRKLLLGQLHRVDYDMHVNWNGGKLEINWSSPLPKGIDSIWITDGFSDFPTNFLAVKVEPGAKLQTDNPAIDRFSVIIWYNGVVLDVAELQQDDWVGGSGMRGGWPGARGTYADRVQIAPHPVTGDALIRGIPPAAETVIVTDLQGSELMHFIVRDVQVMEGSSEELTVMLPLGGLSHGLYMLHVNGGPDAALSIPLLHN
jgi:hypothetical protein